jgi:hypothetical protein
MVGAMQNRAMVKVRLRHVVAYRINMDPESDNEPIYRGPVATFALECSATEDTVHEVTCATCGRRVVVEVGATGGWRRRRRKALVVAAAAGAAWAAALAAVQAAKLESTAVLIGCTSVLFGIVAITAVVMGVTVKGVAVTGEDREFRSPPGELAEDDQFHVRA